MNTRVVHILPNLAPGGAERMAVHLVRGLDRRQFDVTVVSMFEAGGWDLEQMLAESNINVLHLGKKWRGPDFRMYRRIDEALGKLQPQIVHTHLYMLRYALPAMLRHKVPAMVHTVNNVAEKEISPPERWIHRMAFRRGVVPVAVGGAVSTSIQRVYGIRDTLVIPNAIPVERYCNPRVARDEWRAREAFRQQDIIFTCVARFHRQKNHAVMLEAFARGPASHPNARLMLAGEGPLRPALEKKARQLRISEKVRFVGLRTDVPELLSASDVFVLSSNWEGNPLAVMEAMAAGLPIVSTLAGAVPELITDGREGFLTPAGDCEAMARAMMAVLADQHLRESMSQASALKAKSYFDASLMARSYAQLYERMLTGSRPSQFLATGT